MTLDSPGRWTRRGWLALGCGWALPAQTQRETRGREIVDRAIEALGGQKFLSMKDRTETGRVYSFYREQLRGLSRASIYTRYLTPPSPPQPGKLYVRERQSFFRDPKKEDYAILFDEERGWNITYRGAAPVPPPLLNRYHDSTLRNVFYMLKQRRGEPGLIVEFESTDVVDNVPIEKVTFTDAENVSVSVEFHRSTHLPVRQVFFRRDPDTRGRIEEITRFDKYRPVSGVLWPFNMQRMRNGEKVFEIFSETVAIDSGLTDDLFTLGADLKILPAPR